MPLMKCAGNYGVRRESFILHESSGERRQRSSNGGGHREVMHVVRTSIVTLKHMLRISNDAERRRELFSAAPNRGRGARESRLDYALGRRM